MDANGRELPRGEIGEIWIRSGSVIKGYWNNPKATAESFTAGFWHSGDLGSVDAENFVRVFDRQKDMINRGGLKIYSAEVESVLAGHPDVVESAIIAKPCPVLGERVHAVVVTRDARRRRGAARLVRRAAVGLQGAGDHGCSRSEPLPRNANGKVMKRQLAGRRGPAAREHRVASGQVHRRLRDMSIDHDRVGMRHDRHEPDEAYSQRPKRIPVNPVHVPARAPIWSACLDQAEVLLDEFVQVSRHIVPFDVATAADFSRTNFDKSSLQCSSVLKGNHLDRVAELSRQKVGNDSLDVSALGSSGDIVWRMRP